jgi:hypothetical protein
MVTGWCICGACQKLEWLSLGGNQVSDAGLAELKQALPNCQVEN